MGEIAMISLWYAWSGHSKRVYYFTLWSWNMVIIVFLSGCRL